MTILDDNKYIAENKYRQYLQNTINQNASWEIEIQLSVAPTSQFGWLIIEPDSSSNREEIFYHRKLWNSVFTYDVNRTDAKTHIDWSLVVLNNTAWIYNFKEKLNDNIFHHYKISDNDIYIFWWILVDIDWNKYELDNFTTESLSLTNNATNYIYIWTTDSWLTYEPLVTTTNSNDLFVIKEVTKDPSWVITSIVEWRQSWRWMSTNWWTWKPGNGIVSIVKVSTVWKVNTYRITFTDSTTFDFEVIDWDNSQWWMSALIYDPQDIQGDAFNRANHTWTQLSSTISDLQTVIDNNTNVSANTTARHAHSNKVLLDTYTQTEVNLADAVTKKHSHTNKTVLDNTTASFTTAQETKLSWIASWAEVNVNADWNSVSWDSQILNKPTIPTQTSQLTNNSLLTDIVAWTNITIDKTDPRNPIINSTASWSSSTLDWLSDVAISSPVNWQALIYDGTQWENTSLPWGWDMLKATYDTTNNWIVDNSEALNWQPWSYYLNRANHSWSQTANTISDLNSYTWTLTNKTIDDLTNTIWADHIHFKVKNMTGSTIWAGVLFKAVWYESWDQAIRIAPISSPSDVAIGITKTSIAHWAVSLWVNTWVATWIDTSWLTLNTIYYSDWAGWLTATKPTSWYYQAVAIPLDIKVDWSLLVEFTEPQRVNWDDLYYTETEVDTALWLKQNLALTNLASTDLNTIVTNWKYCAATTCSNLPESWVKTRLLVNVDPTNSNLSMQEALTTTTQVSYVRTTTNGWTTWTAWYRIKATDETKAIAWAITTSWLTQSTNKLLGRNTAWTGAIEEITLGTWLEFDWTTLNATWITADETVTLTNKRITPRVTTITSSWRPTINTDNCDAVTITALAEAITNMSTNLSWTPTNFQKLIFRIKDNWTARVITWWASFVAMWVSLPTTTVISKVLTVWFIYDTVNSKWGCVASARE